MRKVISLLVLTLILNLTILSITYGQSSVSIGGIVPETEFNRNSVKQQINLKNQNPSTGENKYLYFFEKTLDLQSKPDGNLSFTVANTQTIHDRISSHLLLWLFLAIVAVLVVMILRIIDKYFLPLMKLGKSRTKRQHYV